jgi:hypothetical protein
MKCRCDGSKAEVIGYGVAGVVGAKAIAATIPEMMRLMRAVRNVHEAFHLSSLIYRLIDPRRLTGGPQSPLLASG